jgi:hypothetical protein
MSLTWTRITDAANRAEHVVDLVRDVVGDDPGDNAWLDAAADRVSRARDDAMVACLGSPGVFMEPGEECERKIGFVEAVSKATIAGASEIYTKATGGRVLGDDAPETMPTEPGSESGGECPYDGRCRGIALLVGAIIGAAFGVFA